MKKFDVIVIGAGSGLNISSRADSLGLKVAVVEEGPMGGTCLNRGCIPSKMLIHSADVAETVRNSGKFGVKSKMTGVDFPFLIKRVSKAVDDESKGIEKRLKESDNTTLFKGRGEFTGPKTLKVGKETLQGEKIFIVAGTRPSVPSIEGIEKVPFITSTEALRLKKQPKTMTVVGGGYIAAELAHFYSSLGTKVTIVQRNVLLVPDEDKEVAQTFTRVFSKKPNVRVLLAHVTKKAYMTGKKIALEIEKKEGGGKKTLISDELLIATGRIPNADLLKPEKAGIKVNEHGFIQVNEFLETSAPNVWALGDIAGVYMFKHSANLEAQYAVNNAFGKEKQPVDYSAMPHAVFSSPQIAGVGFTEEQLREKKVPYVFGNYSYKGTGMGAALREEDGFAKVLVHEKTREILGCHIIGPEASTLIHEVVVAMKNKVKADDVWKTVHAHPALSEVVQRAFRMARPFDED